MPGSLQGQQRNGRGLDMRRERHSKRHAVARVPTAAWTRSIEQHLDAQLDPILAFIRCGLLFPGHSQRQNRERCRDDPARGIRRPGPAELVGIEAHLSVDRLEFPSP